MPDLDDRVRSGFFVRPTVVSRVDNNSAIAREEVFGPVLTVLTYDGIDDAVRIANDSSTGCPVPSSRPTTTQRLP